LSLDRDRARYPGIETARLRLRPLAPEDLGAIHRLWVNPEVRRYLWDDERISKERARSVIAAGIEDFESHGFGLWAVIPAEDEELIGFCGFRSLEDAPEIELLYGISPPYWGMGLATEAARAAIRYGFEEAGFDRILGIADTEIEASRRVLEKAGMRFEKHTIYEGRDEVRYEISLQEFRPDGAPYTLRRA
jgi:[ribosomal protein S5]-alanine N-acetyltransferase